MTMSMAVITVLHSAEVVHFTHKPCSPKSPGFAKPLNISFGEWRGVHYEAFTKTNGELDSPLEVQ